MSEFAVCVPGGTLHGEDWGTGQPVILLHAGVTDRRVWNPTAAALLGAGYRVIRWDSRGYGRSPASGVPYSLVADALAVLDARHVDAAHFVGLGQGAATSTATPRAGSSWTRRLVSWPTSWSRKSRTPASTGGWSPW